MGLEDREAAVGAAIRRVLEDAGLRGEAFADSIDALGGRLGIEPFRGCLLALVGLDRAEAAARSLLGAIEEHRGALEARLGRDPGLPVAALDLLHGLEGTLREPVFHQAHGVGGGPGPEEEAPRPFLAIDEILFLEIRRAERFGRPLALALLAPDHPAGGREASIASAANALRDACRDTDHAARIVPEGFVVILPGTPPEAALRAAERLRRALSTASGEPWSAGLAGCPDLPWDMTEVARAARRALRGAREAGGARALPFRLERRGHPRRRVGMERLAALLRRESGQSPVELRDLSIGGARLRIEERLDPGDRVTLALAEPGARPLAVAVEGRVVRTEGPETPGGSAWTAAVAFREDDAERFRLAGLLAEEAEPLEDRG
jgi:hypothetical protein